MLNPTNDGAISSTPYFSAGGVKVELYAANEAGTGKLNETKLYDGTITQENGSPVGVKTGFIFDLSPTNKYWSKVTTPCGDVYEGMVNNLDTDRRTRLNLRPISEECSAEGKETMVIANLNYSPFVPKGTVFFKNKETGVVVQTLRLNTSADYYTFKSGPLPLGEYQVWIEHDDCPAYNSEVKTVKMTKGDAVVAKVSSRTLDFCHGIKKYTSQTGTIGIEIRIDGYIQNQKEKEVKVFIVSGPSNVGVEAKYFQYRYRWFNMLPGNYVVKATSCGKEYLFNFTVDDDKDLPANKKFLLRQKIDSKAISECNKKGRIESTIDYNHYFPMIVELVDDKDQIVKIGGMEQVSSNGNFANVPPGTYRTRIKVLPHCAKLPNGNYTDFYDVYNDKPLVIVDGSKEPVFVDAQGIACEDVTGKTGDKGTIYLGLAASDGATLRFRKKGTSDYWINLVYAPSITIPGLTPGAVYEFELTSCGKTATKDVKVEKLIPVIKKVRSNLV